MVLKEHVIEQVGQVNVGANEQVLGEPCFGHEVELYCSVVPHLDPLGLNLDASFLLFVLLDANHFVEGNRHQNVNEKRCVEAANLKQAECNQCEQ